MFWTDRFQSNGAKQYASRVPIGLKFAYTAYMATLIPVY
jgi:hypothetical protein